MSLAAIFAVAKNWTYGTLRTQPGSRLCLEALSNHWAVPACGQPSREVGGRRLRVPGCELIMSFQLQAGCSERSGKSLEHHQCYKSPTPNPGPE